jgi:hypothetical protein
MKENQLNNREDLYLRFFIDRKVLSGWLAAFQGLTLAGEFLFL